MALNNYWRAPEANQLFQIEDHEIIAALDNMEQKLKKPQNKSGSSETDKLMDEVILDNLPLFHMLADNGQTRQKKPQS